MAYGRGSSEQTVAWKVVANPEWTTAMEFIDPFISAIQTILCVILATWIVQCAKKKKVEAIEPADPKSVQPANLPSQSPADRKVPTPEQKNDQKKDAKKELTNDGKKEEKNDEKGENKKDEKNAEKNETKKEEKKKENEEGKSAADEVKKESNSPKHDEKPINEQKEPGKPAPEIKPKVIARNAKEERIAKGKEVRGKGDYPTMDDVLSDWDSEKEKKEGKEEDGDQLKAKANLDEAAEKEGEAVAAK